MQGLDGLGHLEDGSGQTGLLGWDATFRGVALSLSLEDGFERTGDGVMARRWTWMGPLCPIGPGVCLEVTGVEGREDEEGLGMGSGSCVGFLGAI